MILQSNDTAVEIKFTDSNGDYINVTSFDECLASLVNRKNKTVLDTFSLTVIPNKKRVYLVDDYTFRVWLEKEIWENQIDGDWYLEVEGQQANIEITDGVQRVGGIIELGKLVNYDSI